MNNKNEKHDETLLAELWYNRYKERLDIYTDPKIFGPEQLALRYWALLEISVWAIHLDIELALRTKKLMDDMVDAVSVDPEFEQKFRSAFGEFNYRSLL